MLFPVDSKLQGRKSHPCNTKLRLWWETAWHDLPVMDAYAPLIANYLEKTHRVLSQALKAHSRLLAVPVLLRYPKAMHADQLLINNQVISRFFHCMNWQLGLMAFSHNPDMRNVWAREQHKSDKPHYHVWLLFNGHALHRSGILNAYITGRDEAYDGNGLYHHIVRAWSHAIGWPLEDMKGLAHISAHNITNEVRTFYLHKKDKAKLRDLFFHMSYACKAYSKPIGQGVHCFDGTNL